MPSLGVPLSDAFLDVVERFVDACRADERVLSAFLRGSFAADTADAYSDLDLGLITSDAGHEEFIAGRYAFFSRLGDPIFLEDFDNESFVFFIFPDGTDGELVIGRESAFQHVHRGPYRTLLDKQGILDGTTFPRQKAAPAEQIERLRRLIQWFWHDLSHFITGMGRGELWWAYGQLEELRRYCVNLALLRHDFTAEAETWEKVEHALPAEQLDPLRATCCPLEYGAMLRAARAVIDFYRELARSLGAAHGIPYPHGLDAVMQARLERLPGRA